MFRGPHQASCCGTTQIGEKGQVVIPSEARRRLKLKKGDKLVTFVKHDQVLVMVKAKMIEEMVKQITEKAAFFKKALKNKTKPRQS